MENSKYTEDGINMTWGEILNMTKEELIEFLKDEKNMEIYQEIVKRENNPSEMIL